MTTIIEEINEIRRRAGLNEISSKEQSFLDDLEASAERKMGDPARARKDMKDKIVNTALDTLRTERDAARQEEREKQEKDRANARSKRNSKNLSPDMLDVISNHIDATINGFIKAREQYESGKSHYDRISDIEDRYDDALIGLEEKLQELGHSYPFLDDEIQDVVFGMNGKIEDAGLERGSAWMDHSVIWPWDY